MSRMIGGEQSWILTDVSSGTYIESLELTSRDLGPSFEQCKITKKRLHGGKSDGVDVVEVENGILKVALLPTRGMGIWKAWLGNLTIGWNSPIAGPIHPHWVPLDEPQGLGFLYGFDELLCRCGLISHGAPEFDASGRVVHPLHGRIANTPAHHVQIVCDPESGEIQIHGIIRESRFFHHDLELTSTFSIRPNEKSFRITDTVLNRADHTTQMELLYHTNFGPPFLEAGSTLRAAIETLVPRNAHAAEGMQNWQAYPGPNPGCEEEVFFFKLLGDKNHLAHAALINATQTLGVSMKFDVRTLPYFSLWKNPAGENDGYVTGLEPGTSFPNPRSFEEKQGRTIPLGPKDSKTFSLELQIHDTSAEIATAITEIEALQRTAQPKFESEPISDWCDA